MACLMMVLPTLAQAQFIPKSRLHAKDYPAYHYLAETPLTTKDGRSYALCIGYEKDQLASGHRITGYVLSPNNCAPLTRLLGLLQFADPDVIALSTEDIIKMRSEGTLPSDLPDTPQLPTSERIKANFIYYLFGVLFGFLLLSACVNAWRTNRWRKQHNARMKRGLENIKRMCAEDPEFAKRLQKLSTVRATDQR